MAGLAVLLKQQGHLVSGSDGRLYSPTREMLQHARISMAEGFAAENLPQSGCVVVGKAFDQQNVEVAAARQRGLPLASLPEVLSREILDGRQSVVVAGTHGKTTTSVLIAHVLASAGRDPGYFLGGLPIGWPSGAEQGGASAPFVVEGDEYATSYWDPRPKFLHFRPELLLCTNLEFDHGNVFASVEEIGRAFAELMSSVSAGGLILLPADDRRLSRAWRDSGGEAMVVPLGEGGDWSAQQPRFDRRGIGFFLAYHGRRLGRSLRLPLFGGHNLQNALAAAAALAELGLSLEQIADGFETFPGVCRRMELEGEVGRRAVVRDFAHHPTAVAATLQATRHRFPDRPIWALFEPRSITSCRRTFQEDYARAFDRADRVLLAPPFRTFPVGHQLDTVRLATAISARGATATAYESIDELVAAALPNAPDDAVFLCMSSGDFAGVSQRLLQSLADSERAAKRTRAGAFGPGP